MDPSAETRSIPTPFIVLLAIGVVVAWLMVLIFLGALIYASGSANPLSGILVGAINDAMRYALMFQYAVTGLSIAMIAGFGTAALVLIGSGSQNAAAGALRLLLRIMMGLAVAGLLAAVASPLAISGSVLTVLPVLLTILPITAVQLGALVLADHYLRPTAPEVF